MPNIFDHVISYVKSSAMAASNAELAPSEAIRTWLQGSGYIDKDQEEMAGTVKMPGETYGPAIARFSRTPIDFVKEFPGEPGKAGEFYSKDNRIEVSPESAKNLFGRDYGVGDTIKHESTHAIMSPESYIVQEGIARSQPGFSRISKAVSSKFEGPPGLEVPAQMAMRHYLVPGVTQQQRDDYMSHFIDSLQAMNPEAAGKLGRMIGGVSTPKRK